MYLTYDQYLDMGGTMDVDDPIYARYEHKARCLIDRATLGRVMHEAPVRDSLKYCAFDLINAMYAEESLLSVTAGRDIASMSNDGVSIGFASGAAQSAAQSAHSRYTAIIRQWLDGETAANGAHLLYAGVDV